MTEPPPPAGVPSRSLPTGPAAETLTPSPPTDALASSALLDGVAAHRAKADSRRADTIWRPNPREQGLLGLTDAIAWFGSRGWFVCLPLNDSQPYDLVVDDGDELLRVQVKTTAHRTPHGVFAVALATRGGNQSFHTSKPFDPATSDLLFVLTDDRSRYVIPTDAVTSRTQLNLGDRMQVYRVAGPA